MSRIVPLVGGAIPIPISQREGFGIHEGSRLIASLFDIRHYNKIAYNDDGNTASEYEDSLGGLLLTPVRKSVLARVLKLTLAFRNRVGALQEVTGLISKHYGNIIFHQGAGNGVTHCHVYFRDDDQECPFLKELVVQALNKNLALKRIVVTLPMKIEVPTSDEITKVEPGKNTIDWNKASSLSYKKLKKRCERLAKIAPLLFFYNDRLGVIEDYLKAAVETELGIRKDGLGVSSSEIYAGAQGLVFPKALYERLVRYQEVEVYKQKHHLYIRERSVGLPRNVLLTEVRDEMAITCVIPRRSLVRISVRSRTFSTSPDTSQRPGVGIADLVLDVLQDSNINLMHTDVHSAELRYRRPNKPQGEGNSRPTLYGERGILDFVGSIPEDWEDADVDALKGKLKDLKERLGAITPSPIVLDKEGGKDLHFGEITVDETARKLYRICKPASDPNDSHTPKDGAPTLTQKKQEQDAIQRLAEELRHAKINPWPPLEVEVYAAPTTRCFLARSASPDPREGRFVEKLRGVLDEYFYVVEEGMISYGQNIESITRNRIKECDLVVTVMWPRFQREEDGPGVHKLDASDWLIHEESYAMGAGIPVFRFREERTAVPGYQRDKMDFVLGYKDEDSWSRALLDCRKQFSAFLVRRATT